MTRKEKIARFIAGTILFIPIYAGGMFFFSDTGIDWVETILISLMWSAGMVVFEILWQKRKPANSES
ncbi:MAG: hypothetical protein CL666_00060 [Balneola sp.]|nr:hypothetical protein [Balneola sp.]|tara:strand:+ start:14858 stop:15058 length:201 start_codon:yes stop_codon:yes gene_type:complete